MSSEGRGEDFRVIVGEDIVYLRMMRRVGVAVGDESEEGLKGRRRVLQWLLADGRQLLGLVGQWIGAAHDVPISLSRSVGCGNGDGVGVGVGDVGGLRLGQVVPWTNWHWLGGGAAEAGCVFMLEPC